MLRRNLMFRTEEALADSPVVLLQGARQTGKTTLARALARESSPHRRYLTLDDPAVLAAARENPSGFIRGVVLYGGSEVVPFGSNLFAVPITALWR